MDKDKLEKAKEVLQGIVNVDGDNIVTKEGKIISGKGLIDDALTTALAVMEEYERIYLKAADRDDWLEVANHNLKKIESLTLENGRLRKEVEHLKGTVAYLKMDLSDAENK